MVEAARGVLEACDLDAPDFEVELAAGRVQLSHYWRDRPALLVFLRHFG